MEKRMEPLIVRTTTDQGIEISQEYGPSPDGYPDPVIRIPVEQIDILIGWLREGKEDITNEAGAQESETVRSR